MRNYFAIAFTIVYLTLAVGVAKTTHYCMGREKNSAVFSFSAEQCVCARFAKVPMECCKDQHDLIQLDDEHAASQTINTPAPQFNLIADLYSPVVEEAGTQTVANYYPEELNLPPPKVPLYQFNCSLVFYDSIV